MISKIYHGEVIHSRARPVQHSFRYPHYFYGLDLDDLPELSESNRLFGYNCLRPVAIHDRDYLFRGSEPIRDKLTTLLEKNGIEVPARVMLVTSARYFHYIFNPVSFFYCYDKENQLTCVVSQVNNTFGDMHLYLLRNSPGDKGNGKARFTAEKVFHVSPFFPRTGHYDFELSAPTDAVEIKLSYYLENQLHLVAKLQGKGTPLTEGSLLKTVLRHPIMAAMTMPRILWQAARLCWQRRLPVFTRPEPASPLTIRKTSPSWFSRLGQVLVLTFFKKLRQGELTLTMPDGTHHICGVPGSVPSVQLTIHSARFFRRAMTASDIGFGESYMAGEWSSPDLPALLTHLAANEHDLNDKLLPTAFIGRNINFLLHLLRPNTVSGSSKNIREHYDLSNTFFSTFLDESMTYSSGLFQSEEDSLATAQQNKIDRIIQLAEIDKTDHVLEIGCGWGSFAVRAAREIGCRVTGITVSQEQLQLARQRVRDANLEELVDIQLCDYRHIEGTFNKIVSIEMLEAVGHAGLKSFFVACDKALAPGGKAVIQVITMADHKYNAYRYSSDWIRKHIFPGGHLPSVGIMNAILGKSTNLRMSGLENHPDDYARTLSLWRETFLAEKQRYLEMGFDESFLRKWDYYFSYCEAGFNSGLIDLTQLVLTQRNDRSTTS